MICDPGYGDDGTPNGGVFRDLDEWIESHLYPTYVRAGLNRDKPKDSMAAHVKTYDIVVSDDVELSGEIGWKDKSFLDKMRPLTAYAYDSQTMERQLQPNAVQGSSIFSLSGVVTENKRLTAEDWIQNTRHLRIDIEGSFFCDPCVPTLGRLPYDAGDVVSILPINSTEEVNKFLRELPSRLQEIADRKLNISYNPSQSSLFGVGHPYWPSQCTLRSWLMYCADIHALPEREDLLAISQLCSRSHPRGRDQREKLETLSQTAGSALYADYILREKRNWADVLHDFDSLGHEASTLTLDTLFALLAPIRPREFSIASSPTKEYMNLTGNGEIGKGSLFSVELCVAVVEGMTPLGRKYNGLCSKFLSQCRIGSKLCMWIRPGTFSALPLEISDNFPHAFKIPMMCIGAGTGIAPLRGLLHEREARRWLSDISNLEFEPIDNEEVCDNLLIFGCRKKEKDFYYSDEWEKMKEKGVLSLFAAFSRDQEHKVYVMQVLQKIDLCRHVLDKNGAIYIAGGAKMSHYVRQEIMDALVKRLGDRRLAQRKLMELQQRGHFSIEAWS